MKHNNKRNKTKQFTKLIPMPKEICGVIETSKARFDNPQLVKVLVAELAT
jgi:hypothetical protein